MHWVRRSCGNDDSRFPGGESYPDVDARAALSLRRREPWFSEPTWIVSREVTGRMLLKHLLNLTPKAALNLNHPQNVI